MGLTDPRLNEAAFMQAVIELALYGGWLVHHTYDSRRSRRGFPDLVLARPGRLIFAELKVKKRRMTREQSQWFDVLRDQHTQAIECYEWRPEDWHIIERVLAA